MPFPDSTPAMHNESAIVSESATNEMTSQLQPRVVPGQIDTSLDCSQTAPAFPGSSKSILITSGKWHFREWFLFSFIKSVSRLNSKTYIPLVFFSGNFISYRLAWGFCSGALTLKYTGAFAAAPKVAKSSTMTLGNSKLDRLNSHT